MAQRQLNKPRTTSAGQPRRQFGQMAESTLVLQLTDHNRTAPLLMKPTGALTTLIKDTLTRVAQNQAYSPASRQLTQDALLQALLSSLRLCWGEFQLPGIAPLALHIAHTPALQQTLIEAAKINPNRIGSEIAARWPDVIGGVLALSSGADDRMAPQRQEHLARKVRGRRRMDAELSIKQTLNTLSGSEIRGRFCEARLALTRDLCSDFQLTSILAQKLLTVWSSTPPRPSVTDERGSHALMVLKFACSPAGAGNKPQPI